MKSKYEILSVYANDFGKAFKFVRQEMLDACVEIVKTEADDEPTSMRQNIIDKMRKLGPTE